VGRSSDVVLGLLFAAGGAAGLIWVLPDQIAEMETASVSPAFFPRLIVGLITVLGLALAVQGLLAKGKAARPAAAPRRPWVPLLVVATLPPIWFAFSYLGVLAASALTICALMLLMGERRPLVIVGCTGGISVALMFLAYDVLGISGI